MSLRRFWTVSGHRWPASGRLVWSTRTGGTDHDRSSHQPLAARQQRRKNCRCWRRIDRAVPDRSRRSGRGRHAKRPTQSPAPRARGNSGSTGPPRGGAPRCRSALAAALITLVCRNHAGLFHLAQHIGRRERRVPKVLRVRHARLARQKFLPEPPRLVGPAQFLLTNCKARPAFGVFGRFVSGLFQRLHSFLDPAGQHQGGTQTTADLANHWVQQIYPERPIEVVDRRGQITDIDVNPARRVYAATRTNDRFGESALQYATDADQQLWAELVDRPRSTRRAASGPSLLSGRTPALRKQGMTE
jgi:hypothetical protein